MRRRLVVLAAVSVLLAGIEAEAAKHKARWVIIHQPSEAADHNAREFSKRVAAETGGEVEIEVLGKAEYAKMKYGASKSLSHWALLRDLREGKLELAQTYTGSLALLNRELQALSLPYLFRDYDHAEAVFEGPVGVRIRGLVPPSSGVRTLAVTYCGGFEIMATKGRVVRKPADLKGLKFATERLAWAQFYARAFGVEPTIIPPEAFVPMAENGFVDATETSPSRFYELGDDRAADTVIDTRHSMLTTMIAINEKFFQSLPEKHRRAIEKVALETAREERQLAIRLNAEARPKLEKKGVRFVDLTKSERAAFEKAFASLYDLPAMKPAADLAAAIRAAGAADTARR